MGNNKRLVEYITISADIPVNVTGEDILKKQILIDEINTCFHGDKYPFCGFDNCKNKGRASFNLLLHGNKEHEGCVVKEILTQGNMAIICIKHYREFIKDHKNADFGFKRDREMRICTNGKIIFVEDKNNINNLLYPSN